jgi:acyl-CoA synthetase (AMP-forming)/AMP-acid ligase II/acyl carrier protein
VAGPDFAYDLSVRSIKPEDRAGLDLRTLRIAFTGAEPVRQDTIDRFTEAFAPFGFRRESFYPCYGLAEATLIVTGGQSAIGPSSHQSRIACGGAVAGTEVRIVNPETRLPCRSDETGEIWVRGPGVAQGYWKRTDATIETFAAHVQGDTRPWLRTGDLGFLAGNGQLCIAGRIKDLIIIRGRNHHPNDIEQTTATCHPALHSGGGAAFSIDVNGSEQLVIAHEIERTQRNTDPEDIFQSIRQAVARAHELAVHAIVLLKPSRLPRTSSGKVRRHACREAFLAEQDLGEVARWIAPEQPNPSFDEAPETGAGHSNVPQNVGASAANELESWLVERLAATLKVAVSEIDPAEPFARYGLDSANAVGLACQIETELKLELEASLLWDYPSVRALAGYLAGAGDAQEPPAHQAA